MAELLVFWLFGIVMFLFGLFWGVRRRDEIDKEAENDPVFKRPRLVK